MRNAFAARYGGVDAITLKSFAAGEMITRNPRGDGYVLESTAAAMESKPAAARTRDEIRADVMPTVMAYIGRGVGDSEEHMREVWGKVADQYADDVAAGRTTCVWHATAVVLRHEQCICAGCVSKVPGMTPLNPLPKNRKTTRVPLRAADR